MSPATALLLHGFASGPASMWRFEEWLAGLGYQAEARAQLGHGGRGPAATLAAARRPEWPTLVICGDPAVGGAVTLADGDAVASANPNVRLARIAGAGHSPHRDDPEAVRRALLGWLAVPR